MAWQHHLETLPGETALEQEHEGVGQGLQVIPPAAGAPQVGMDTGVPDCAPEVVWLLLILDMLSSWRPPLGGYRPTQGVLICECRLQACLYCTTGPHRS